MLILGLKICVTGALVMLLISFAAHAIGDRPSIAKGLPLLMLWFGGAAAVVIGLLMAVWA